MIAEDAGFTLFRWDWRLVWDSGGLRPMLILDVRDAHDHDDGQHAGLS
jgi:hypothetical protein